MDSRSSLLLKFQFLYLYLNICRRYDVRFPLDTQTIMLWTLPTSEDPCCAYSLRKSYVRQI